MKRCCAPPMQLAGAAIPTLHLGGLVMSSSLIPGHVFNSLNPHELPSGKPELQNESDRLKLLLDMTNTLVSNLEFRDLLRAISASIRRDMHCDVVGVLLPDSEQRQLRSHALDFPETKGFVKEGSLHGCAT
jgi:transcriptional regulator with GAF, ATPase, and Fis domain